LPCAVRSNRLSFQITAEISRGSIPCSRLTRTIISSSECARRTSDTAASPTINRAQARLT
jgi:hypothetical protein